MKKKIIVAILFINCATAWSQVAELPLNLQSVLFKKIFSIYPPLSTMEGGEIVVLSPNHLTEKAFEITKNFEKIGIKASVVLNSRNLENRKIIAIYFFDSSAIVSEICTQGGILSITGRSDLVEDGEVSLGFRVDSGKPIIVINKNKMMDEGHQSLFKLLEVKNAVIL